MKPWMPRHRLAVRMITFVFVSVFIITAVIFTYIYRVSHDTILRNLKENSRLLTASTANDVEKLLTAVQKVPANLSGIIEEGGLSTLQLERLLALTLENNPEVFSVAIAFEPGAEGTARGYSTLSVCRDNDTLRRAHVRSGSSDDRARDWYLIPKELQRAVWSEPYYDQDHGNIKVVTYSLPLYRHAGAQPQFIGILAASLTLSRIDTIVSSIKVYETGYAYLISRAGILIAHPKKELIVNASIFSLAEDTKSDVLREIGRNMIAGRSSFAEVEYHNIATGKLSWLTYAPVTMSGWSLGIVYPVDELTEPLNSLSREVLLLAGFGALILLLVIVLIARSITRPLGRLASAARHISQGNFDSVLPRATTRDEIGELTEAFSVMQDALKQTIESLKKANDTLEEYSRTLEEKVETRTAEVRAKNAELEQAIHTVKTLSLIGQQITASLNLEAIFATVYGSVSRLIDATSFSIMILNETERRLECKVAIENGHRLPEFNFSTDDKNRFAVWCVDHRQPVFINDVDAEFSRYVAARSTPKVGQYVASLLYQPLIVGDRVIGVISAQSFRKNAYTETHVDVLRNVANYTAIALDNAFAYDEVNRAHTELKQAQTQLIQSEKMASLGQLTAGIAHEIKNPLNFITNFAELSVELITELNEELERQFGRIDAQATDAITSLLADLEHNARKINDHGKRADGIVKGMLLHSRGKAGEKQRTNLNELLDEYLHLGYHGFRAQDATFNVRLETDYDPSLEPVSVVPQEISRAFLNIINNGCYSVHEKKRESTQPFTPVLRVSTANHPDRVEIRIRDNGKGIPPEILDKVFNPFFTTKPTGKGTGLGLSLTYDIIVHEHGGELTVVSEPGEYAEFVISIPKTG